MPEYSFDRDTLKRGLNLVRAIKPSVGDVSFSFGSSGLTLFSFDNRRYARVEIAPSMTDAEDGFRSDEYYIFLDKTAIFDTELETILINVNESSLDIKASGGGQTRRSSLKKRSTKSRRPAVPKFPDVEFTDLSKRKFDELLRAVSCSASIKDAKTEDDMRIMQIHFYGNGYVTSSTRYHASMVYLEGMSLDTSIISADIPLIRAFISKFPNDSVGFGQDKDRIYFADLGTNSFLSLAKSATERPTFKTIDDEFGIQFTIDHELLSKNLRWASLVVERTQRISLHAVRDNDDSGRLVISFQKQEADGIPVRFLKGNEFKADLPIDKLEHIVTFLEDRVCIKHGHPKMPWMMEITSQVEEASVQSRHYLASMRPNEQ